MVDIKKFLDVQYLFDARPPVGKFVIPLAILFASALFLGVIFSLFWRTRDQVRRVFRDKVTTFVWTCAIVGGMLTFFRWQRIPVLSSRILLALFFVVSIIWLLTIIIWRLRVFPVEMSYQLKQKTYQKYLPRKKYHK